MTFYTVLGLNLALIYSPEKHNVKNTDEFDMDRILQILTSEGENC